MSNSNLIFSAGLAWHGDVVHDEQACKVLKAALAAGVIVQNKDADKVVVCIKSGVVHMKAFTIDRSPEGGYPRRCSYTTRS
ncbi:hypothetical protein AOQ84DRAFT_375197 [Glonium stellatum]|uniref:Uncharacterized protein n=1 Tax=Glonium stellatum TaxID=574774 RepID=A0A8E2JUN1_9PEZI|nr:hypothetical protein AOQ84DRAFT_375197 [Glonium stellatum]